MKSDLRSACMALSVLTIGCMFEPYLPRRPWIVEVKNNQRLMAGVSRIKDIKRGSWCGGRWIYWSAEEMMCT